MEKQPNVQGYPTTKRIPLSRSLYLLFHSRQLFFRSLLLVLLMAVLCWLGYFFTVTYLEGLVASLFGAEPESQTILGRIWFALWLAGRWLSLLVIKVLAFYLSFLLAYTLCTPGYALLSTAAEELHAGNRLTDETMTVRRFLYDLWEGLKIALFGLLVTLVAFFVNFIPALGQLAVLLIYVAYSTLMFIDFPASRAGWPLRRKLRWLAQHGGLTLRLGLLPALVSMIPLVNIFAIALLFPLLTIHATLNFAAVERPLPPAIRGEDHAG